MFCSPSHCTPERGRYARRTIRVPSAVHRSCRVSLLLLEKPFERKTCRSLALSIAYSNILREQRYYGWVEWSVLLRSSKAPPVRITPVIYTRLMSGGNSSRRLFSQVRYAIPDKTVFEHNTRNPILGCFYVRSK